MVYEQKHTDLPMSLLELRIRQRLSVSRQGYGPAGMQPEQAAMIGASAAFGRPGSGEHAAA